PRRWMRTKFRQVVSAVDRAINQPDYANSRPKSHDFGYNSQSGGKLPPTKQPVDRAMNQPDYVNSRPKSYDFIYKQPIGA
ncbi:MAG: hypothetical protein LAT55_10760, partial [Opitutales bacterium]|nr:hypothetical protein [Opitutales bacterium]